MFRLSWQRGMLVATLTILVSPVAYADPYEQLASRLLQESSHRWLAHAASTSGAASRLSAGRSESEAMGEARDAARNEQLAKLLPAMRPSAAVAHLPREHRVTVDPEQHWTKYYEMAKTRLRPRVEYAWSSNATQDSEVITLSESHIATLRENFDVVMWYRRELEVIANSQSSGSAGSFKLFLDHMVAGILDDMPQPPKINLSDGTIERSTWRLDEKQLREQIVVLYRYLSAKYQIFGNYEEFAPADLALLSAWMKISALLGASINDDSFEEMRVELTRTEGDGAWKQPISEAFKVLQERANFESSVDPMDSDLLANAPQPTIVKIPPPAPKKSAKKATPPADNKTVLEIIVRQAK